MKDISPNIFAEDKLIKNNHYPDFVYSAAALVFSLSAMILPSKDELIIKAHNKKSKMEILLSDLYPAIVVMLQLVCHAAEESNGLEWISAC
jgi:hypothetical protein